MGEGRQAEKLVNFELFNLELLTVNPLLVIHFIQRFPTRLPPCFYQFF